MHQLLRRHAVQTLLGAGHSQVDVAARTGVSQRSVRRIGKEAPVSHVDDKAERRRRRVGRPSKTEPFRDFVAELLAEEPRLMSLEILRRARAKDYDGGKSAMYELVRELRPLNRWRPHSGHQPQLVLNWAGALASLRMAHVGRRHSDRAERCLERNSLAVPGLEPPGLVLLDDLSAHAAQNLALRANATARSAM